MTPIQSAQSGEAVSTTETITVHLLCPSISPATRFTIPDVSLDITVASLRSRIEETIPSRPAPAEQRLIFRGRSFTATSDSISLREAFAPLSGNEYSIHVMLPLTSYQPTFLAPQVSNLASQPPTAVPPSPFQSNYPRPIVNIFNMQNTHTQGSEAPNNDMGNDRNSNIPLRSPPGASSSSYFVSSLNGNVGLVFPTEAAAAAAAASGIATGVTPGVDTGGTPRVASEVATGVATGVIPGPHIPVAPQGVRQNEADAVARQGVANEQMRQNQAANGGAGQLIRRIWLFVRLYFFIYMISDPGTWRRIFFVTIAVIISLLSDSEFPEQLYQRLLTPIQGHLERLTHAGGPAEQPRQTAGHNGAEQPPAHTPTILADVLDYLWRAERSVALLLASLIPGISERQVQARNAAEAEAERQRLEEQRRQLEEQRRLLEESQRAREHQQEQGEPGNSAGHGSAEAPQPVPSLFSD